MNRRTVTLLTLIVILSILLFVPGSRSSASLQTGTPESATPAAIDEAVSELPADLDVKLLASSERTGLPSSGVHLQVDRIRLSPGEQFSGTENGFSLIAVEAGSVNLSMSATTSEVAAGASFSIESGEDYLISAVGAEDVVLIRVTLDGPTNSASPVASPVSGIVPQLLAAGDANRLVSRKGTLFLAQVTIAVGGATGEQIFSGPIAIAVDAGAVTVDQETGSDLTLDEGFGGIVQGFSHFNAMNTGDETAVLIVAGLLAPVTGAASGPTPTLTATPTAGVDSSATAIASAESAAIEATTAALQNEIALAEDAKATVEAALVLAESSVAALSADLTVVNSNLVTANTTVEAQASAIAVAEATQTADAQTIASVIAANADRSRELASANQTVEALTEDVAAADAEVIAREAELAAVNATASAQADELGAAEGSATQQAGILSSVVAIVESQSNALDSANATASEQAAAIDAANATATAQASQIAAADATASAQAAAIDSANANSTAVASTAAVTEEAQTAAVASAQAWRCCGGCPLRGPAGRGCRGSGRGNLGGELIRSNDCCSPNCRSQRPEYVNREVNRDHRGGGDDHRAQYCPGGCRESRRGFAQSELCGCDCQDRSERGPQQ